MPPTREEFAKAEDAAMAAQAALLAELEMEDSLGGGGGVTSEKVSKKKKKKKNGAK